MVDQRRVARFLDEHDLRTDPASRVLDLASEVGELAKDVNESTDYGTSRAAATVSPGELGDALFCVLALAAETGIDAEEALTGALAKYEDRIDTRNSPGSGE